jgi:serine/threonine protein kinase
MSKRVAIDRKMTNEFFMERAMLAQVNHTFLCNAQHCFQDRDYCYIVLDLAMGGDIRYHMTAPTDYPSPHTGGDGAISEEYAIFLFAQVVEALGYLHTKNIIHRDIKVRTEREAVCARGAGSAKRYARGQRRVVRALSLRVWSISWTPSSSRRVTWCGYCIITTGLAFQAPSRPAARWIVRSGVDTEEVLLALHTRRHNLV